MLVARLAEPRAEVDETGRDHRARRVDAALGMEVGRQVEADADDAPVGDGDRALLVAPALRVDQPGAGDERLRHGVPACRIMRGVMRCSRR